MMKPKLTPLVLLIPAVVLAQSNAQNPIPTPQPKVMQGAPMNPADGANPAKATEALKNAQKTTKEIKGKLPSSADAYGSSNDNCSTTGEECYYTGGNG